MTRRLAEAMSPASLKRRATATAAALKAEYEAGKRGDDQPSTPLWASPKEQLDAVVALLRLSKDRPDNDSSAHPDARLADDARLGDDVPATDDVPAPGDVPVADDGAVAADAATVAEEMRKVDWAAVRAASAERSADASRVMRSMADQVDWAKVQPVAGRITSALIAAVASGHLPVGGRVGSTVARAIVDQGGLGQRVTQRMSTDGAALPPDFRSFIERPGAPAPTTVIETTAIEVARPPTRTIDG